jgi:hypothetical protein
VQAWLAPGSASARPPGRGRKRSRKRADVPLIDVIPTADSREAEPNAPLDSGKLPIRVTRSFWVVPYRLGLRPPLLSLPLGVLSRLATQ